MSVDNAWAGNLKYSAEIRTQAYAMQNMSHQELCQEIIEIDNKAHMVGFKNGKFAMKSHPTQTEPVDSPEQILKKLRAGIWEEASGQCQFQDTITVDEALAALEAYYKAQASKDMSEVIGKDTPHKHATREYCDDCAVRDIENKLRREQRKTAASKGYKV